jgi:AcrR family transcriptional regulator
MSGNERRGQIVRVASALFAKKGFKGTTTRLIAERAGISEAVIFKHFTKKADLYKAIIRHCCEDEHGSSRLLNALKGRKGKAVFTALASFMLKEHRKDPTLMRLITYSALERNPLSDMFIRTKGLELIEFLESHIRGLVRDRVFRRVDPAVAARAFIGMVLQYSISQELYGLKRFFKRPDEKVVNSFVGIFFDGMRANPRKGLSEKAL